MQRTLTRELPQRIGQRVLLEGWMHNIRSFPDFSFLILRDRTGNAQVILEPGPELEKLHGLQNESVLRIEGTVVEEERSPLGVDVRDAWITVVAPVTEIGPFELNKKVLKPSLDVFLNHAAYGLRHPSRIAVFRIMSTILAGYREFLLSEGFTEISTPKLVGGATEGGANVFPVQYFDRTAYLAQSPQLYKQIMVGVFERVFEIGPAFRAEEHATSRHLNEFTSLDLEMGFIESQRDVMDMLRRVLQAMIEAVRTRNAREVELLRMELPRIEEIPSLKFREAQQMILERHGEDRSQEPDLSPQDERWICEWGEKEHGSQFVFVTHFPSAKKPFYSFPDPEDPEYSETFDLLFRGSELVSGGRRINDYAQQLEVLEQRGIDAQPFEGFLEAFKYGMPPEGGFAIGAERFLARLAGAENLRETTLFPRDINRLTP
ncbi:MAG TPA: aspartate--tRNA(Asn) ligase [Chloroflexota bacterium]|nr:aspartate--tRNA(Asn) ligase [Chloroflexota bacterium]